MSETILGIDLGTTNSEVAIVRDGKPFVFEEDGDPILPSFVGLSEDGKLLVGKAARNQYVAAPRNAPSSRSSARWARTSRSSSATKSIGRKKSPR